MQKKATLSAATQKTETEALPPLVSVPLGGKQQHPAPTFNETAAMLQKRQSEIDRGFEALREANEMFQALFQASPVAIVVVDLAKRVTTWNRAAEGMFGWSQAEVLGKRSPLISEKEIAVADRNFIALTEGREIPRMETRRRTKDGSALDVSISMAPIFDTEGRIMSVIVMYVDITKRKQAEKEIEEQRRALYQNEKLASIGQLAAGVAHELNNPISFVKSNMGTLREYMSEILEVLEKCRQAINCWDRNERESCCLRIAEASRVARENDLDTLLTDMNKIIDESQEGAERVAQIVRDLKGFAHADEADLKYANINRGLESTLNIVWNELKYKATVIKELGEIPEIECYPMQLNQVFMNLLVNAAQAIPEKGEIRIKTYCRAEVVVVEISDTGVGIPAEHLSRIFEPFFSTKPVGKGTGLGLSISHGIVKKHGGRIEVQSEPGKGTLFRVSLPREKQAAKTEGIPTEQHDVAAVRTAEPGAAKPD